MRVSGDKEVRQLCDLVIATGRVSITPGGTHIRLFWKDTGRPVMDGQYPVVIASTPSSPSWRRKSIDQLVRAGVFTRTERKHRPARYTPRPLAERARELMLDPRPEQRRVTAVCREIARLEA